jgi:single-stranded-DNA-specific exonuclease
VKILRRPINSIPNDLNHLHPVLQKIYAARGVQTADELNYNFSNLLSYQSLSDLNRALNLLEIAFNQQENVLVIGDFDADGATSTALLVSALKNFGLKNVSYLIPNRFEFGYGLTPKIVTFALEKKPHLIITVDSGISSNDGVALAKANGIKVLITDHHLPPSILPDADAIINPNKKDDPFPSKNLAGVGVVFYLMLALRNLLKEKEWFTKNQLPFPKMSQFMDLVALGTVSDVAVLDRNNRILVTKGLLQIRSGDCRFGIKSLLACGQKHYQDCNSNDLAFVVAPRLNAAGRLTEMSLGVECLLTESLINSREYAKKLDQLNNERKVLEKKMQNQALVIVNDLQIKENLPLGLCLFQKDWHQGIIGILAGRIKDALGRPVIAFTEISEGELKGSARSIPGIHVRDLLEKISFDYPYLISNFGGHAMAAGISLSKANLEQFSKIFNQEVESLIAKEQISLTDHFLTDGELPPQHFSLDFAALLKDHGPWGQGFPEPLFDGIFNVLSGRLVGEKHLKLDLRPNESLKKIPAIYFNPEEKITLKEGDKIRAAYRLDINEYNGIRSPQLIIKGLETL